jgi:hypothetical protein
MAKTYALGIIALISLLGPVLEVLLTGRLEPFGNFALAEAAVSIVPIYWWYWLDKEQRAYRAGPLLNAGVIAAAVIALPIYFIRSRGWKRGGIATALAAGFLALNFGLESLGEAIGQAIAS